HERLEVVARDRAVLAEDRDVEILVEPDLARLERADRLLVPVLKVGGVEVECLHRGGTLLAIPRVASEYAADIEQHELDPSRHPTSTARDGAPSRPGMRSGRTRSSYGPAAGADRSRPSTMTMPCCSKVRCVR